MFRMLSIVFFLVLGLCSHAQAPEATIFNTFSNVESGCDLPDDQEVLVAGNRFAAPPPPPPPPPRPAMADDQLIPYTYTDLATVLAPFLESNPSFFESFAPESKELSNGSICFYKNGQWGLQKATGKVILKPQFSKVVVDTVIGGFIGFKDGFCNYYNGKNGKPLLTEDYYDLMPVAEKTFIVQGPNGYGIVREGEVFLSLSNRSIKVIRKNGQVHYEVTNADGISYILLSDGQTKLPRPLVRNWKDAGNGFIIFPNNIYDLNTKKQLVCKADVLQFKLLDDEKQIVSVKEMRKHTYYLSNYQGEIIFPGTFARIEPFSKTGNAIATLQVVNEQTGKTESKVGVLKNNMEWLIAPNYKSIKKQGEFYVAYDVKGMSAVYAENSGWIVEAAEGYKGITPAGAYFVLQNSDKKKGLVNDKKEVIIPLKWDVVTSVNETEFLCSNKTNQGYEGSLISATTGKVIAENINAYQLSATELCGKGYYGKNVNRSKSLLSAAYEQKIAVHYEMGSFFDHLFLVEKYGPSYRDKYYYISDCEGNKLDVNVAGAKVDTLKYIKVLSPKLALVQLLDDRYFLTSDGQNFEPAPSTRFQWSYPFGEKGHRIVTSSQLSGVVNDKSEVALPAVFKGVSTPKRSSNTFIVTLLNDQKAIVNLSDGLVGGQLFTTVNQLDENYFVVKTGSERNGKFGLIDANGNEMLPIEYDYLFLRGGHIIAKKRAQEFVFDKNMKPLP